MPAVPIIQSTQFTPGAGTPGQGRNDLVIGETVTLSDTEGANSGASYSWTMVDRPIGSAAFLVNPLTATPTFVPDVTGTYYLRATVNSLFSSDELLAVPLPNTGSRIPAFQETTQYDAAGNAKGWHEAMTAFMRDVDSAGGGVGSSGQKFIAVISLGDQDSYASNVGKIKKTITFNPSEFVLAGATRTLELRATAGLGATPNTGRVKLINETDADDVVANLAFTVAPQTTQTVVIPVGAGAGQIDNSAKVYRLEISVDGAPTPADTIEFGGATLHVINTIT